MIIREKYIAEVRGFYKSDLIKIITGVRRCGKSVILEQIMDEIRSVSGNIVYLDFDDRAVTSSIETWQDIVRYVQEKRTDGLCYVFLDEVQEIEGWPAACRSLRRENCSVFITGSNSKLLSREFTSELSGRYVSFRVRPFVYRELLEYGRELGRDVSVTDYLIWGGFPKRLEFGSVSEQRRYLNDLDNTIVSNDIIGRYGIRKAEEFKKAAGYVLISNARIFSANSIQHYLASEKLTCSINTVMKYLSYLEEAYVIRKVPQYSTRSKRELSFYAKNYDEDVSFNTIRQKNGRFDLTHNLENIVYNELIYRGYEVSVFTKNGQEIDFLAQKNRKEYLVQVAYSVAEEKTYEREFALFNELDQSRKKILITNDDIDYSTSTVEHIQLSRFLLMESLEG